MIVNFQKPKRQKPKAGDYFFVELADESLSVGQVIQYEERAMWSFVCAFFNYRVPADTTTINVPLSIDLLVAVQFVTPDLLKDGYWRIFANTEPISPMPYLDIEAHRAKDFIGTGIEGSGIMRKFMSAFYGLSPWDEYARCDYFDKLLVSPDKKPAQLLYSGRHFPANNYVPPPLPEIK